MNVREKTGNGILFYVAGYALIVPGSKKICIRKNTHTTLYVNKTPS
jgi:hypothetical protein